MPARFACAACGQITLPGRKYCARQECRALIRASRSEATAASNKRRAGETRRKAERGEPTLDHP